MPPFVHPILSLFHQLVLPMVHCTCLYTVLPNCAWRLLLKLALFIGAVLLSNPNTSSDFLPHDVVESVQ